MRARAYRHMNTHTRSTYADFKRLATHSVRELPNRHSSGGEIQYEKKTKKHDVVTKKKKNATEGQISVNMLKLKDHTEIVQHEDVQEVMSRRETAVCVSAGPVCPPTALSAFMGSCLSACLFFFPCFPVCLPYLSACLPVRFPFCLISASLKICTD